MWALQESFWIGLVENARLIFGKPQTKIARKCNKKSVFQSLKDHFDNWLRWDELSKLSIHEGVVALDSKYDMNRITFVGVSFFPGWIVSSVQGHIGPGGMEMKSIIAAIAAAIRTAFRVTWTVCKRTGRLVMALIPDPGATPPQPVDYDMTTPHQVADQASADPGLADRVKTLATTLAMGDDPSPEDFKAVPPRVGDWLLAMDRVMLCRVIGAPDADLKAHLMGNGSMRGVIACDERAIYEYVEAMSRPEPEPDRPAPRRTMQPAFA